MGWKTSILILCSMAHYTLQITSQQTYGQLMNKQQIYGQFAGKQPLLAQYSNHLPVLAQYNGNQQPSQFAQNPSSNSFSNQQGSQPSNQQGSAAQFNNLQPTPAQFSGQKQQPGQMAFASQLNGKQQQQMLHLQQQQMVVGRLRTRWAGPYKPYYSQIKGQPQLYRPQKQYVTVPNAYGPAYVYKAPKIQNPKFRPTGVKSSEPLMANPAAYAYYAPNSPKAIAQMQQASKLQPSQPYKFVSSPQIKNNAVSAVAPTNSFMSIQQSQTTLTSTNPPKILASAPFPVSSNKYFEQYKQNYDGEVKSQSYEQGGSVSQNNQYLSAVLPVRTTVVYPVRGDSDRGPIHTIPAPNLSLADKPIVVADGNGYGESQQSYFNNQYARPHTYEVTEETKDKVYKNPYSGESKLYAPDPQTSLQNKLSASNYFTNVLKQPHPQDTAFKAQSVNPSLSSQELFRLLNGSPSQQQLADTYNFPLLQQPQLSQHFLQQTLDSNAPLQPFKAIVQPTRGDNANVQQNVLFKPDPKYVQKIQEQYYKPSSDFQPNYHTFNYEEPNALKGVEALQNELMKTNVEKIIEEDTANSHHTNYIRNTQEGSASNNNNVIKDSNTKTKNKTENDSRDFYNHQSGTSFIPTNSPGSNTKEFSESSPLTASYFTQVSDPKSGSVSTNYYSSLSDRNVANTLLAVQSANHLINVGNSNAEAKEKSGKDHSEGQNQYFNAMSRNGEYTIESIESDSNSGFTPIKSSPLTVSQEDNKAYDQAPLRIYVSDQYDDIETHSSQNIHVSASLNANQNDFRMYNTDDGSNEGSQQDYEDYTQIHKTGNNATSSETERAESDHLAESQSNSNNDVVVTLQKNESNPSLDILTKDWKTSIIIKPTEKDTSVGPNLISEYGSRTRPKRD